MVGENELCKVADFGLLRELPPDDSIYVATTNIPCPVRWMAPENIENRTFSTAYDVWSFGILHAVGDVLPQPAALQEHGEF